MKNKEALGANSSTLQESPVFSGEATGGTLVLHFFTQGSNSVLVEVPTEQGETAANVLQNAPTLWELVRPGTSPPFSLGYKATAGTETGLGIPEAPKFLTAVRNWNTAEVVFHWRNPAQEYDSLRWSCGEFFFSPTPSPLSEELNYSAWLRALENFYSESGMEELKILLVPDTGRLLVRMAGFHDGTVSNHAALSMSGFLQEELFDVPFTGGVTPNWATWQEGCDNSDVSFEQGVHDAFTLDRGMTYPARTVHSETMPVVPKYYQKLKTTDVHGLGGMYRAFLGLTGGHEYRITLRVNTLGMSEAEGEWTFALFASSLSDFPYPPFDSAQLAGWKALPKGGVPPGGMCIARFDNAHTTQGAWEIVNTESKHAGTRALRMPVASSVLLLWVAYEAKAPSTGVAFDYVGLEDMGPVMV